MLFFLTHWVQYTHGCGAGHALEYGQPPKGHILKEHCFFLPPPQSHQLSVAPQRWGFMSPSLIYAEMLTGAISHRSWVDNQSCFQVIGVVILLCAKYIVSLWSSLTSDFCSLLTHIPKMVSELCGKGVWYRVPICAWALHSTLYFDHDEHLC